VCFCAWNYGWKSDGKSEMNVAKKKCVAVKAEPGFYEQVRDVFVAARQFVHKTANFAMVKAYWLVGKMIVEKQLSENYVWRYG
jgi:hypothetical protein